MGGWFLKLDYCIFFQLAKANQIGSRFLGQKVAKLNITPVQALVLGFLRDEDRITSSELGKRTELDSATLTGIIDRLEAAGLIERRGNPADRRSIQVHLTERGRLLGTKAVQLIAEANVKFLEMLTEKERGELRRLIGKLRAAATK
jgi:MarR family transcriptional regulator, organic hydroperoxide resistance regulator